MNSRIAHHLDFAACEMDELEHARLRHAHRLAADLHRSWTRDDLMRLEPVDILPDLPAGVPLPSQQA